MNTFLQVIAGRARTRRRRPSVRARHFLFLAVAAVSASAYAEANHSVAEDAMGPPRFIETHGITMAVYSQGEGFPIVFCHGFPELAFSWRHQLRGLSEAGYHALAPDQRGYGRTDRPEAVEAYDIHQLCGDMVGLLDAFGIEKAVFCGHDWGGFIVWMMPLLHPERTAGVIGVNTPYAPRMNMSLIEMMRRTRGESNYMVAFQAPGVADALMDKDPDRTLRIVMRKNGLLSKKVYDALPPDSPARNFELLEMLRSGETEFPGELVFTEEEFAYYVETFRRTGFTGGINWYRNLDRNWETTPDLPKRIEVPSLYVGAADDAVLPPSLAGTMRAFIPNLDIHIIQDCGHWTQQEKPEELNAAIINWMDKTFGSSRQADTQQPGGK